MMLGPWLAFFLPVIVVSSDCRCAIRTSGNVVPGQLPSITQPHRVTLAFSDERFASEGNSDDDNLEYSACASIEQEKKLHGKIDRAVINLALSQLTLPMGVGRYVSVNGQRYLFCLEPHYHAPGSGRTPYGWHKGVTVYYAT